MLCCTALGRAVLCFGGRLCEPYCSADRSQSAPPIPTLTPRCGCPWWSSEEWDARCLRCGWDCESQGYDNDSQPLPKHRPKWETFTAAIREGRTPAWSGKATAR